MIENREEELSKIEESEWSRPPNYHYKITFDKRDFPGASDDWTQLMFVATRRRLTEQERINVVGAQKIRLIKFAETMSPEKLRWILAQPMT